MTELAFNDISDVVFALTEYAATLAAAELEAEREEVAVTYVGGDPTGLDFDVDGERVTVPAMAYIRRAADEALAEAATTAEAEGRR